MYWPQDSFEEDSGGLQKENLGGKMTWKHLGLSLWCFLIDGLLETIQVNHFISLFTWSWLRFQCAICVCRDSPGGSRGWQTSSTASSTFLVAGQSSPQCRHWNGPLLNHMEILDVTSMTQLYSAYFIHGSFLFQNIWILWRQLVLLYIVSLI